MRALESTLKTAVADFGIKIDDGIVLTQGFGNGFSEFVATVAIYFGAAGAELPEHSKLVRLSIPIVPLVSSVKVVSAELPICLRSINAMALDPADPELVKPTMVALQCLGLLPVQRRVFLSYRRDESRDVAVQLFEALSSKQFDVFLDTHSVAAGVDFQSMLWHRLCDSDVLVMLDTPGYFESRWTDAEWGRAIAKHISILQVVWPGHVQSRHSKLATPLLLQPDGLDGTLLTEASVERLALELETLRSKSIAIRHASIAGSLQNAVEDLGGSIEGIGQRRSIVLKLPSGAALVAYPSVGVPTAVTLHEAVHDADTRPAIVVYDHVGLSDQWVTHIDWLRSNFTAVKWLKSREACWGLADMHGL
jgi:hypothetical protein